MSKASNHADRKQARKDNPILAFTTDDISVMDDEERADSASSEPGRSLLIRLLRWDEVAVTPQGREAFVRGAFANDPTSVLIESQAHGGAIVGKGEEYIDDGIGPLLRARVSATTDGNDLLTLIKDGVLKAASVVFRPTQSRQRSDGVIERMKADLKKVAILPSGAYPSAEVLAVRSEVMSDVVQTPEVTEPAAPVVDLTPIYSRFDAMDEAIARVTAGAAIPGLSEPTILSRYDSYGEAWLAATSDPEVKAELHRALADQTTADNPGLVPAAWVPNIRGFVNLGRRGIGAFGGAQGLPASGMEVKWPKVDDTTQALDFSAIVAEQLTEKAEIVSAKVSFDSANAAIRTFAGGSDISWQLLRRSDPSYREAYLRFMTNVWARVTDTAFMAAVLAGAAGSDTLTIDGTDGPGSAEALLAALFKNSVIIEAVVGQPANVVLAASDVFAAFGGMAPALPPAAYGTQNVAGTAQASNLVVNASGLTIVHEPNMALGKMVIAAAEAAKWHEDGSPFVVDEADVAKLGQNVAVWSMGAAAIYEPNAIVVVTVTLA